jgi:LemA protein
MRKAFFLSLVLFLTAGLSGCNYNDLTAKQQNVRGKWAGIETQLQRRADLIPNLFEAAKAAGVQEQEVFGQIAAARSQLLNATGAAPQGQGGDKTPEQKQAVIDANNSFGGTIGRLLSIVENYPTLKSSDAFMKFQDSLEGTENRISTARNDYNTATQDYNTSRSQFPGVLTASIFGFKEEPFFKAEEGSRQAPTINSNDLRRNNAPNAPVQNAPAAPQQR